MKEHPATKLNYDKSAIQVKYAADKWKESGQIDVLMDGHFAGSPHLCFQNCSTSINDGKDNGNVKSDGSFGFRKHANLFTRNRQGKGYENIMYLQVLDTRCLKHV
ncbi:hypothetical protein ACFX1T_003026 [Malus domestica]